MLARFKTYLRSTPGLSAIAAFILIGFGALAQAMTDGSSLVALIAWAFACMFIAAMLYSVRRTKRWIYGIVEGAFALLFCLGVLLVARYGVPVDGLSVTNVGARMLALMGAVYVAVRAYDNVGEGLPHGSTMAMWWGRLFPKA
jgi:hypothetical protein